MNGMRVVPPSGSLTSKIYVVGEAPGDVELALGKPFVGPSGNLLWSSLLERGIRREDCRVNNIISHKLPSNKWEEATEEEIQNGLTQLKIDILACRPKVILCLGSAVLFCLTGKRGVDNWRGSVLCYEDGEFRCNLLPTFHPVRIFRQQSALPLFYFDLGKLRQLRADSIFESTPTDVTIAPSLVEVHSYADFLKTQNRIAFDIETYPSLEQRLSVAKCIAFAHSESCGMCIPLTHDYWKDSLEEVWEVVRSVLQNGAEKEGQNGQFDIAVLEAAHSCPVHNYMFDTMCAQHVAYPELPKSLAVLCSIYTNRPYYKFMRSAEDTETLWRYNAIDALVTFEAAMNLRKELEEHQTLDFYNTVVHPMIPLMVELQKFGIRVDMVQMLKLKMCERLNYAQNLIALWEAVGWPVNPNSPKQLMHLLYDQLALPPIIQKRKPSVDKVALRKLAAKHKTNPIFNLVLACRRALKQDSTYLNFSNVRDSRMHTSYNIGGSVSDEGSGRVRGAPETGRLSSSASIVYYSGANLQNITRGRLRSIYTAEPGQELVEADLSQAEARVVAFESNDLTMIKMFETGQDIHLANAELIRDVAPSVFETYGSDLKRLRNDFAKHHVHAFNYGEGPCMFAERAGIERRLGERIRDGYFNKYRGLERWHQDIQTALRSGLPRWRVEQRTLRNCFGRRRYFFARLDDSAFREAYAYVPQSTVGDLLNIQFVRVWKFVKKLNLVARPLLQVHDSQVWSINPNCLPEMCKILTNSADIELTSLDGARKYKIPVEFKHGKNWGEMKGFEHA